jgi:hypothetical protein
MAEATNVVSAPAAPVRIETVYVHGVLEHSTLIPTAPTVTAASCVYIRDYNALLQFQ